MEEINNHGFIGQQGFVTEGGFYMVYLGQAISTEETMAIVNRLRQDSRILLAIPHTLFKPDALPPPIADPLTEKQNHLHFSNIFLGLLTLFPNQGKGVTIAAIDTGVSSSLDYESNGLQRMRSVQPERPIEIDDL